MRQLIPSLSLVDTLVERERDADDFLNHRHLESSKLVLLYLLTIKSRFCLSVCLFVHAIWSLQVLPAVLVPLCPRAVIIASAAAATNSGAVVQTRYDSTSPS